MNVINYGVADRIGWQRHLFRKKSRTLWLSIRIDEPVRSSRIMKRFKPRHIRPISDISCGEESGENWIR